MTIELFEQTGSSPRITPEHPEWAAAVQAMTDATSVRVYRFAHEGEKPDRELWWTNVAGDSGFHRYVLAYEGPMPSA